MEPLPDLIAITPGQRKAKLEKLLHDGNGDVTAFLNMNESIFQDVLEIIMPPTIPLGSLMITVTAIEEWHQHPTTSWLSFRCAHSGKLWHWHVRDLDDGLITHLLQISSIDKVLVDIQPPDASEHCQVVNLWTKIRDVSWILSNLRKISELSIQFHPEFLKGGEWEMFWRTSFTTKIAGVNFRSDFNFCSLVAMALILPLLHPRNFEVLQVDIPYPEVFEREDENSVYRILKYSPWVEALSEGNIHDGCKTFDISRLPISPEQIPLPQGSESDTRSILRLNNRCYSSTEISLISQETFRIHQYMDAAVDEVQGFEGEMLRLRRMRLYNKSCRNCLSAHVQQRLNEHAVFRNTEMERLLSPDVERTTIFDQAKQKFPKLSLNYNRIHPAELPLLQARWGRDEWMEKYPQGLPPFQRLSEALGLMPLDCGNTSKIEDISKNNSSNLMPENPTQKVQPQKQVHWQAWKVLHEIDQDEGFEAKKRRITFPDDLKSTTEDAHAQGAVVKTGFTSLSNDK